MSAKKHSRMSEQISGAVNRYISRRKIDTKRSRCVSVAEMTSRSVLSSASSSGNLMIFSTTNIDYSQTESQYTAFKFWISESDDHYKPELAQLLYPLFTHLYITLLVSCQAPSLGQQSPAAKFHIRHRPTFSGNPEFKQFIQLLGEVSSAEDLNQNQSISSFRSSKYSVTLTERTYKYLLRYLEDSESGLLLQILNQEVDITIGDPLGSGSRQEMRQGIVDIAPAPLESFGDDIAEMERLDEIINSVRGGPGAVPSIALYRVQCDDGLVTCASSDERGGLLCLGGGDSQVRLVSTQPGGWQGQEIGASVIPLGCDKDGPRGHRLDVEDGDVRLLRGHSGPVYGVNWVNGGGLLTCSEDTTVRYWDRDTGAGLAVYRGHQYPVWDVVSDKIGLKFVTVSLDRTLRLWQTEFNHPLRVYSGHDGSVDCAAWHPNCNYIISGSSDKTVRMWTYTDATCVRLFPGGKGAVTSVAMSPDGKQMASAGEDRKVRIWDLAQGTQVKELRGHLSDVSSVVWCQDSRHVITGTRDGSVRVFDTSTGGDTVQDTVVQYSCGLNTGIIGANFTDTNTLLVTAVEIHSS